MTAIEIDQRAVALLKEKLPNYQVIHEDVLAFDWYKHSQLCRGRVSIVANLPYHIVSQVLFSLADHHAVIDLAVVTMQYEVAARITAKPNNKEYGIPSVVFQLYAKTKLLFNIPPTVFFPVPKVDSALVHFDFTQSHPIISRVNLARLRQILGLSFRQRRKMLRQSLKPLFDPSLRQSNQRELYGDDGVIINQLPSDWREKRPEQLTLVQYRNRK
jgi:16S rRNA A1518/A1519 N6-dimethyltransferase RsmA/KsgA/DIM1 with predicted DNA glycosylase/AP lyase activity